MSKLQSGIYGANALFHELLQTLSTRWMPQLRSEISSTGARSGFTFSRRKHHRSSFKLRKWSALIEDVGEALVALTCSLQINDGIGRVSLRVFVTIADGANMALSWL